METKSQGRLLIFLCVIVFLTVVAVLSANLGFPNDSATTQSFAKWGLGAVLAEIIGLFVFVARQIYSPQRRLFSLVIFLPQGLEPLADLISWDLKSTFLILMSSKNGSIDEKEVLIVPARSEEGRSWQIRLPSAVYDKIGETDTVRLLLTDAKGNKWEGPPFFLLHRQLTLMASDTQKIKTAYGVK